jgi:tRNA threonylcarbamoyladenosine biosynthesis protein TsaE
MNRKTVAAPEPPSAAGEQLVVPSGAPMTDERSFLLSDEDATRRLAAAIAAQTRAGDVIALSGRLGCGKTVFARAFVHARGLPAEDVPSPTFTLVQIYEPPPPMMDPIHHFDLYRLTSAEEAYELGIEDAFAEGIALIEWPERLGTLLPADRLDVELSFADDPACRRVRLSGGGDWPQRLAGLSDV